MPSFEARFISPKLSVKNCLEKVETAAVPVANEIMVSMADKALRQNAALRISQWSDKLQRFCRVLVWIHIRR